MSGNEATQILKRELRKRIGASLRALPPAQLKNESDYLTARLLAHPAYQNARSVAMYASLSMEVDTSAMMRDALAAQKRLFLPRVLSKSRREMAMLEVRSITELDAFDRGAYGIPEPPMENDRPRAPHDIRLDLIVVPGVAFDMRGGRCGHGMGYYDVFLARYAQEFGLPMPSLVALALSPQMVDQVPVSTNDWLIEEVIASTLTTGPPIATLNAP